MHKLKLRIVLSVVFAALIVLGCDCSIHAQKQADNKSDLQVSGPYDVVENWPKPMSVLPGHEKWTWGAVEGVFAQNPNRIYVAMRGEIPVVQRPKAVPLPQFGPSISFPVSGLPFRNASSGPVTSLPEGNQGKVGVDARWEHCLFVLDAGGNMIEAWTQWDTLFRSPHFVTINPYDPEKHVWVADDKANQIFEFSNDGKKLILTLGEKDVPGNDEKHFAGPADIAWLPDGTMFVSDGYVNSRVIKFDKSGKYLMSWGQEGVPPNEKRPGYFNLVHGIAIDAKRRVYVDDRTNRRIQIFDENGKFLSQWYLGEQAHVHHLYMTADQYLWLSSSGNEKMYKFDLTGQMLSNWGTMGDFPGAFWGVHQFSVDQEGNFYTAEIYSGRVQKFRPRKDADKSQLVGQPVRAAWTN